MNSAQEALKLLLSDILSEMPTKREILIRGIRDQIDLYPGVDRRA